MALVFTEMQKKPQTQPNQQQTTTADNKKTL